jgi:hypothetical protein
MVAALVAVTPFIAGNREDPVLFRVLALLSLVFLLVSVYKGGKGVAEVIGEGKKGIWQAGSQKDRFDQQAVAGVPGVAFLIAATAVGLNAPDRDSSVLKRVETLEQDVRALDVRL